MISLLRAIVAGLIGLSSVPVGIWQLMHADAVAALICFVALICCACFIAPSFEALQRAELGRQDPNIL